MLPALVDGNYEFETEFTRNGGSDVQMVLPVENRQVLMVLSGWGVLLAGFASIDGKACNENATRVQPSRLENGRRYVLRASVSVVGEQAAIEVFLDGKPYTQFRGNRASLSLQWSIPQAHRPALRVESATTFHRARLRLVSGRGYLFDRDRKGREPYVQTPEIWGGGSFRFHDFAPEGSRLVGLRLTATNVLHSIQPIYSRDEKQSFRDALRKAERRFPRVACKAGLRDRGRGLQGRDLCRWLASRLFPRPRQSSRSARSL